MIVDDNKDATVVAIETMGPNELRRRVPESRKHVKYVTITMKGGLARVEIAPEEGKLFRSTFCARNEESAMRVVAGGWRRDTPEMLTVEM